MSVTNYLNSPSIYVDACATGALQVFESTSNNVSVRVGAAFDKEKSSWIDVIRDMMLTGNLCAIVDVQESAHSLRDRLVDLSVAGVDQIKLAGRTQRIIEENLSLAIEINYKERLGLRISQ